MKIAVIGGGAAGFFAAIAVKENYPDAKVIIFEKANKTLSKVKISGGGRCNVTNACESINTLSEAYPRGSKMLKRAFYQFSNQDTMKWFERRGVPLVVQEDNCVFPKSQDSQTIIDCFYNEINRLGIIVQTAMGVESIVKTLENWSISFIDKLLPDQYFDTIIVTTGGAPKIKGLEWLMQLGHKIENPVPSLFTFNMPKESITKLMGIVVKTTQISIQGTKLKSDGPLLITHWGMSGPAILKLSARGARILNEMNYDFVIQVNWVNERNNETVFNELENIAKVHEKKILINIRPYGLQERLWDYILMKIELSPNKRWGELGKKSLNKMVNILTNDSYQVKGKTKFKDEFVTCGGVSLDDINHATMQSKVCDNLYFAGEVLDIDGITGGYNFQAAWTTSFIAGKLL